MPACLLHFLITRVSWSNFVFEVIDRPRTNADSFISTIQIILTLSDQIIPDALMNKILFSFLVRNEEISETHMFLILLSNEGLGEAREMEEETFNFRLSWYFWPDGTGVWGSSITQNGVEFFLQNAAQQIPMSVCMKTSYLTLYLGK